MCYFTSLETVMKASPVNRFANTWNSPLSAQLSLSHVPRSTNVFRWQTVTNRLTIRQCYGTNGRQETLCPLIKMVTASSLLKIAMIERHVKPVLCLEEEIPSDQPLLLIVDVCLKPSRRSLKIILISEKLHSIVVEVSWRYSSAYLSVSLLCTCNSVLIDYLAISPCLRHAHLSQIQLTHDLTFLCGILFSRFSVKFSVQISDLCVARTIYRLKQQIQQHPI
jgi:hypothetical protein